MNLSTCTLNILYALTTMPNVVGTQAYKLKPATSGKLFVPLQKTRTPDQFRNECFNGYSPGIKLQLSDFRQMGCTGWAIVIQNWKNTRTFMWNIFNYSSTIKKKTVIDLTGDFFMPSDTAFLFLPPRSLRLVFQGLQAFHQTGHPA